MLPFIVLAASFLVFRTAGWFGAAALDGWAPALRAALAVMFLLTASGHWGKRRPDLIRMVPPSFPRPDFIVTMTGILEVAGAIGLLIPRTAPAAALCLAILLVAMFPANVHAARKKLTIGGKPATALSLRTVLQLVFIAALIGSAAERPELSGSGHRDPGLDTPGPSAATVRTITR